MTKENLESGFTAVLLLAVILLEVCFNSSCSYFGQRQPKLRSDTDAKCTAEEDCIVEAIYDYEIRNSESHLRSDLFFLSRGKDQNPSDSIVQRLKSRSYRVKPVSQSVDTRSAIKDKDTGESGIVLSVGKVKWVNSGAVEVEGAAYSGWGDIKGYVYYLVRGQGGWMVTERKFALESRRYLLFPTVPTTHQRLPI